MFNNIDISNHISFIIVFFEGLISFLSPCILPLIPLYISYLAGNTQILENGTLMYKRKKVFLHTLFFSLGICCTFFLLGISFTALGRFFSKYQTLFTRIGGIIIILLGLFQLGIFNFKFLQKERKFNFDITKREVNPLIAFIMGFTFSFAWTPCVGPALSSVLILASSSKNSLVGNILVLVYSLGFVIPFLILGLFTTKVLNFFKEKQKFLKYTVKISGFLLILIGIMTFTGYMNSISRYLVIDNNKKQEVPQEKQEIKETETTTEDVNQAETKEEMKELPDLFDFTLTDQYGNTHTLSDYKGKVVFLNFWATWCKPCLIEMPHIEEIYKEYGLNKEEVIILGVANPSSKDYLHNSDVSKEEIIKFIEEQGYTFPIVFDETGQTFKDYFIRSFPTTFMINKEGKIYGYLSGAITKDIMKNIIEETLKSTENK
ncbi:redoxin domain-containing protein [[Clostridium] colinum]|uniref:redoxin domain-containing protein n=1 Tax=[Clostridium] colinum TaxID=36835 RepID=UPI002024D139|nr:cytochrome c biogenesis protein CcdA [[Clostridium] colinum]